MQTAVGGGSEHPKKKPVSAPDLRAVAHYHRTQCPDQNGHWVYEGQHFWLRGIPTSDKNGNACISGTMNFKISFKIWLLMHMMPYTGKVPWPSSATAPGLGGGNDKLAMDKGGNLPEKVENHWARLTELDIYSLAGNYDNFS